MLLVLGLLTGTAFAADFSDLVILHTNDTHGYDRYSEADGANGMAAVAAVKEDLMARGKEVLLLDVGDTIQGNNLVNLSKGASAIEFMNGVGYDAMCLGNHEFDYGQDVVLARARQAKFPVLACNLIVEATGKTFVPPSVILRKGKHKIGIVGILTPTTVDSATPTSVAGLRFLREEELYRAVQREVDALKQEQCDLILALEHLGNKSYCMEPPRRCAGTCHGHRHLHRQA